MKIARHSKIIDLINQYDIETQEELAAKLQDTFMTPRTFPHLSLLPRPRPRTARRR